MVSKLSKLFAVAAVAVVAYVSVFFVSSAFLFPSAQQQTMIGMMQQSVSFGQNTVLLNAVSILAAILAAFAIAHYLKIGPGIMESPEMQGPNAGKKPAPERKAKISKEQELEILKKALNGGEKKVLDEVEKAGEITQDSLRFRLGWSKAKISTILSNLDRKNLVQRERTGKTYKVFLEKKRKNAQ
ncbi:MAG: hypothetical protein HY394_05715 [Candidatus Diapherotrites archaeon]|nr:hypothetical protein [Candidatus Diapherotrites archaeon]